MSMGPPVPLKSAIAWSVVDVIWRRRRASHPMVPLIARPMDGNYFCVALMHRAEMRPLLMMNLAGTSFWIETFRSPGQGAVREALKDGYVDAFVQHGLRKVVAEVEEAMGLPPLSGGSPATTRETIGIRVLSALMQRQAFADEALIAESGFQHELGVMPFLVDHPAFGPRLSAVPSDDWVAKERLGSELWRIRAKSDFLFELNVVNGRVAALGSGEELDMYAEYERNGRRLSPIADWIFERT